LTDERSRKGIAVAERYADGLANEQDLVEAERGAQAAYQVAASAAAEAFRARDAATHRATQPALSAADTAIAAMNAAKAVCCCCAVAGYEPAANVSWYEAMEGESAVLEVIAPLGEVPGGVVTGLDVRFVTSSVTPFVQ
jgi:hypothetical protein